MCEICGQNPCSPRCPNYSAAGYPVCEICEIPIQIGEEYIENDLGEFFHYGCIDTVRQAIDWLGYEIKTLEDQFE